MGYKLVARIRDDKTAVGYIIQDTRSKTYEILQVVDTNILAAHGEIENAYLNKQTNTLSGIGTDLRKLKNISESKADDIIKGKKTKSRKAKAETDIQKPFDKYKNHTRLYNILIQMDGFYSGLTESDIMQSNIGLREALGHSTVMRKDYQYPDIPNMAVKALLKVIRYNLNGVGSYIKPIKDFDIVDYYVQDFAMKFLIYIDIKFNNAKGLKNTTKDLK